MASETALAYFQLRTLQEQERIAADMLKSYERTCKVYETRYRLGQSPETTLRRFAAERDKTQAQLYDLEERRIRCEGALAVLAGFSPAGIVDGAGRAFQEGRTLGELAPPPDVPSGIPSDLLQRRPDVRSAEGRLMAANARIGAARAAFFPSFSLTAEGGYSSTHLDRVFLDPARIWDVMGGLAQPLFEGGRLTAKQRMAEAKYEEARAAYMGSVRNAFTETRDALAGNRISRKALAASTERVKELTRSNEIMEKQYDAGLSSVMDLLDVRRQLLAARQEQAEARRRQLAAVVGLCKALGGAGRKRRGLNEASGRGTLRKGFPFPRRTSRPAPSAARGFRSITVSECSAGDAPSRGFRPGRAAGLRGTGTFRAGRAAARVGGGSICRGSGRWSWFRCTGRGIRGPCPCRRTRRACSRRMAWCCRPR